MYAADQLKWYCDISAKGFLYLSSFLFSQSQVSFYTKSNTIRDYFHIRDKVSKKSNVIDSLPSSQINNTK